jgi:peptide/nickel transport system permease protein
MTRTRKRLLSTSYVVLGVLAFVVVFGGLWPSSGGGAVSLGISAMRSTGLVAAAVVILSLFIGLAAATLATLGPPAFDLILARVVEIAGALPSVVVVAVVASVARAPSLVAIVMLLALKRGLESAKVTRAELLQLTSEDFVLAARAAGIGPVRLLRRHFLPHVVPAALARATLGAAAVVGLDAAGSFLGIFRGGGSWGTLIAEATRRSSFTLLFAPAALTAATIFALTIVADAAADKSRLGRRFSE